MSVLFTADRRGAALWASLLVVAGAALAAGLAAPSWVSVPLVAAAAALVVHAVLRGGGRTWVENIAYASAGILATLVLIGLGLDIVPGGITRTSWSVVLGIVCVAVLVWSAHRRPAARFPTSLAGGGLPTPGAASWYVGALVVVAIAIGVSVHSARVAQTAPAQLSLARESTSGTAVVQVRGGAVPGRFELASSGSDGARVGPFRLSEGETHNYRITVPTGERTTVTLRRLGSGAPPLRLVLFGEAFRSTSMGGTQ